VPFSTNGPVWAAKWRSSCVSFVSRPMRRTGLGERERATGTYQARAAPRALP
jgi:hypothetical protein